MVYKAVLNGAKVIYGSNNKFDDFNAATDRVKGKDLVSKYANIYRLIARNGVLLLVLNNFI